MHKSPRETQHHTKITFYFQFDFQNLRLLVYVMLHICVVVLSLHALLPAVAVTLSRTTLAPRIGVLSCSCVWVGGVCVWLYVCM